MSYMTATQTTDLGEFMDQLDNTFETYGPSGLDLDVEIKVAKWGKPMGTIIKNGDGIVFVPAGPEFQNYTIPTDKVSE